MDKTEIITDVKASVETELFKENTEREITDESSPLPVVLTDEITEETLCENVAGEGKKMKGTPITVRLIGGLLCLIFCASSSFFYIKKSIPVAEALLSSGIEKSVNYEIFDNALILENNNADTENGDTVETESDKTDETDTSDTNSSSETADTTGETNEKEIFPISEIDLSSSSPYAISNETNYTPSAEKLSVKEGTVKTVGEIYDEYGNDAPCVLIVHTHGTEAYSSGSDTYSTSEAFRTSDTSQNVVAVGDVMESALKLAGVNVIHDRNMYDTESYKDSYSHSYSAVKEILEKNPSVSYVLDIHRDAIIDSDKTKYRTSFTFDGMKCAQLMIVVGTDEGGAEHDNWENNLSLALKIQKNSFSSISDSMSRNINLRSAAFNQALSGGSLLLEIGSCGNTLVEAKRCGVLCALSIAETIGAPKKPDVTETVEDLVKDKN